MPTAAENIAALTAAGFAVDTDTDSDGFVKAVGSCYVHAVVDDDGFTSVMFAASGMSEIATDANAITAVHKAFSKLGLFTASTVSFMSDLPA